MQLTINRDSLITFTIGLVVGVNFIVMFTLTHKNTDTSNLYQQIQKQQHTITVLTEQKESDLRLLQELRRQLKKKK